MKLRIASVAVLVALLGAVLVAPLSATAAPAPAPAAQATNPLAGIPISGTVAGVSSFVGTFDVTRFAVQNGQLVAVGTLTGTLTNLVTGATQAVSQQLALPVTAVPGATCDLLDLTLGPLDLDLLGLVVHLDRIVLDLSAAPGAGNLLGNLLCSITNALNASGNLTQIANLLNQLLGLLG